MIIDINHEINFRKTKKMKTIKSLLLIIFLLFSGCRPAQDYTEYIKHKEQMAWENVITHSKKICLEGVQYFFYARYGKPFSAPVYDKNTKEVVLCDE